MKVTLKDYQDMKRLRTRIFNPDITMENFIDYKEDHMLEDLYEAVKSFDRNIWDRKRKIMKIVYPLVERCVNALESSIELVVRASSEKLEVVVWKFSFSDEISPWEVTVYDERGVHSNELCCLKDFGWESGRDIINKISKAVVENLADNDIFLKGVDL